MNLKSSKRAGDGFVVASGGKGFHSKAPQSAERLYFDEFRSLLSEEELKQLVEACDMALELNQSKHRIYEYVESRMSFIAPNLSIIVGASTAAKLMGEKLGFRKLQPS